MRPSLILLALLVCVNGKTLFDNLDDLHIELNNGKDPHSVDRDLQLLSEKILDEDEDHHSFYKRVVDNIRRKVHSRLSNSTIPSTMPPLMPIITNASVITGDVTVSSAAISVTTPSSVVAVSTITMSCSLVYSTITVVIIVILSLGYAVLRMYLREKILSI